MDTEDKNKCFIKGVPMWQGQNGTVGMKGFEHETKVVEEAEPDPLKHTREIDEHLKRSCLLVTSIKVVKFVERLCGLWGLFVARNPISATLGCLVLVTSLGFGLFNMNVVYRPYDLWVPKDSEFSKVTQWKIENFPPLYRKQVGIWEAENVLKASIIRKMWELHLAVENMTVSLRNSSYNWKDVCLQYPADYSEETLKLANDLGYGSFVCYETSLLEIWGYNSTIIYALSDEQIVLDVNTANVSKLYGSPNNFSSYLSGIKRDEFGSIQSATAMLHTWVTRVDSEEINRGRYEMDVATGDKVDLLGMAWERSFVRTVESLQQDESSINIRAGYTLSDVLRKSITRDVIWIIIGWIILILYVIITIGKPLGKVNRILPAIVGLISIALAVLACYGACSMIGIPYGTLTNVLPVLLVALGVDDMYVIVTSWDKISRADHHCAVDRKTQLTMEHAGMAITVTSATDILAFLVGTSTSLPGLRWFCIYSAVGISIVYILQATLFVAAMVVNERWQISREKVHDDSFASPLSNIIKENWSRWQVKHYIYQLSGILMKPATKVIVVVFTITILMFSTYSILSVSHEFDAMWLVPKDSSLYRWYKTIEQMFPEEGEKGVVFFKGAKLPDDIPDLVYLTKRLEELPNIVKVDGWFQGIDLQSLDTQYQSIKDFSPEMQCELLLAYIEIKYRSHFRANFEDHIEEVSHYPCSQFLIEFQYFPLDDQDSKQLAMANVREVVKSANISGYKAAWAHAYSYWETDRIIIRELLQSLCIVLSVVTLICLILLASVRTSLLVLICVVATLVDVASFVHLWGLTINTITSLAFVLAVGICVDYATHIAHDFLIVEGTKDERVRSALLHMGSAVFHGGVSTLIAFLLLAPSGSYIFVSYFKILTGVSLFGLFHALVFLPVMLSLVGPNSYPKLPEDGVPKTEITTAASSPGLSPLSPAIASKEPCRYSADASVINFYVTLDPPPYILHQDTDPPLYRKSTSLPCLVLSVKQDSDKDFEKDDLHKQFV